jgi:hypothetical protein
VKHPLFKENRGKSANSIQNLDSNVDSKSSAQNRPFDSPDFLNPAGGGGGGVQDPGIGNLRVDNRFSAIDYERIRQNYYSDPPINQQRNFYASYNDIPLNNPGLSYRSPIGARYSDLSYNGAGPGRPGLTSSDLRYLFTLLRPQVVEFESQSRSFACAPSAAFQIANFTPIR